MGMHKQVSKSLSDNMNKVPEKSIYKKENSLDINGGKKSRGILKLWHDFRAKHKGIAEFLVFLLLSNGITVLQMILMPMLKSFLDQTSLIDMVFQVGQIGHNFDGSPYYIFDYAAGSLGNGGGGGLAYFLSVQITLAIAQVINFFAQRNITFKSSGNIWKAAGWYLIAFILITLGAATLQGFYKAPVYDLFINTWELGKTGETLADFVTMIINATVSFWVYFPILKIIFKEDNKNKI